MQLRNIKEKRLRALLKEFCKDNEVEGVWINALNPSNIEFEFTDLYKNDESSIFGDIIYFDPDHEAKHLFPYLVKELYLIKQKRKHRFEYFINQIFGIGNMHKKAEEKQRIAEKWIAKRIRAKN